MLPVDDEAACLEVVEEPVRGACTRAGPPVGHPASRHVGLGEHRHFGVGENEAVRQRRGDHHRARRSGSSSDHGGVHALLGENAREPRCAGARGGTQRHGVALAHEPGDRAGQTRGVTRHEVEAPHPQRGRRRALGHRGQRDDPRIALAKEPVERHVQARERVLVPLLGAPGRGERLGQSGFFVEELHRPVPDAPRFDEYDLRTGGQQIGQHARVAVEERQPRLHAVELLASLQTLPDRGAPGAPRRQSPRGFTQLRAGHQLSAPVERHRGDVVQGTLVAHGERRQAVDLVTPQVDPHRYVRCRREDVDDAAAHGELPSVLDLVLAPVAARHELVQQRLRLDLLAAHDHERGCRVERREPLQQRPHRTDDDSGCRPGRVALPQRVDHGEPAAHRLDLRADPLEGQRLPGGEDGHRPAQCAHVVLGRRPFLCRQ